MDCKLEYVADARLRGLKDSTLRRFLIACEQLERSTGVPTHLTDQTALRTWLRGCTPGGAAFNLRTVRPYFRWCLAEGIIQTDPTAGVFVRQRSEPQLTATDVQIETLLKVRDPRDHAILSILIATGCRRGELGLATYGDARHFIDSGMLLLSNSKTVRRVVPLTPTAERALRKWLRLNHERPDTANLWNSKSGAELVARVVKRQGLTTHSIRRWFVANWLKKGGSLVSLGRLCGWSPSTTSTMASIYSRGVAEEVMLEEFRRVLR